MIPIGFAQAPRFVQDRALPLPPVPALAGVGRLKDADGDERHFLLTDLVRQRNRVAAALGEAAALVESGL